MQSNSSSMQAHSTHPFTVHSAASPTPSPTHQQQQQQQQHAQSFHYDPAHAGQQQQHQQAQHYPQQPMHPSPAGYMPSPPNSYSHYPQPPQAQQAQMQQSQYPAAPASLYQTHGPQAPNGFSAYPQQPFGQQQHQQQQQQAHGFSQPHYPAPPLSAPLSTSSFSPPAGMAAAPAGPSIAASSAPGGGSGVVLIGDRCARLFGMLWHPDFKLRLNIPDSILFCNGAFHSYLFTSRQHRGEIRKKSFGATSTISGSGSSSSTAGPGGAQSGPKMTLESIRSTLVRKAEQDSSNVTPFVAVLQEHDAKVSCVKYHALPRVLRSMGALPESHRLAQASFAGVPHQAEDIDLYQLLRAYVHPLNGARFVTTYVFNADGGSGSDGDGRAQLPGHSPRPRHSLSTTVGRFADRYQVLPEERAFYEVGVAAAGSAEESKDNSGAAAPTVAESVLRECERMSLCVVEWLSRIHNVSVAKLEVEFVQNYSRKLILHSIVDVAFRVEPEHHGAPSLAMQLMRQMDDNGDDGTVGVEHLGGEQGPSLSMQSQEAAAHAQLLHVQSFESGDFAASSVASSGAPSRNPSRPASASVAGGRTARIARALSGSASSAAFAAGAASAAAAASAAPAPYASATLSRSGYNTSTAQALTSRPPSRPQSARPSGSATQRFSSDDLESQFRNTQPPRGLVGLSSSGAALPRTARQKMMAGASRGGVAFTTMMQFETRTEMDERMAAGSLRAPPSGPSADGTSSGGRADFLLFHWRHQAREGHQEVVRLNAELDAASKAWATKEAQLMALLHMEEKKVALLSSQNQSGQIEISSLKHALDEQRLASTQSTLEAEQRQARLLKEADVSKLLVARLEEQNRRLQDELLQIAAEKGQGDTDASKLRREVAEANRARARAEHELDTAQKVRDELLEKLEGEERFARNLAQQLDLMSDWESFEDMRHLFAKASGLARNEGQRLKEVEALRAQVVNYTKDKAWQDKKLHIQRQAKALKKSHAASSAAGVGGSVGSGGGRGSGVQADPVPERRATDVLAERALNRMTH